VEADLTTRTIKNIGFISTRISGTDGVSLEISKWAAVLERNGFRCYYFAGELDQPSEVSHTCPAAHFFDPSIAELQKGLFGSKSRTASITAEVHRYREVLKKELYGFIEKYELDCIIPENILAIPMNVPLGLAVTEVIAETGIPTIAHHHDFSWERDRFLNGAADDFLAAAFPPVLPSMRHVVINSIAFENLTMRRGVAPVLISNVYDFANPPKEASAEEITSLRRMAGVAEGDPMILQPTRIVPRKCIERAIDLAAALEMKKPLVVTSHSAGDEGSEYLAALRDYAEMRHVELSCIDDSVSAVGRNTSFSFRSLYSAADFVTYPSGYEGFGNALLETVYYRRPLLVNRYPVFIRDIESVGFDFCLMDGLINREIVAKVEEFLYIQDRRLEGIEKNYDLARRFYSLEVLEKKLLSLINSF